MGCPHLAGGGARNGEVEGFMKKEKLKSGLKVKRPKTKSGRNH
jgi:hypothetical protein